MRKRFILLTFLFLVGTSYRSISLSVPHLWRDEAAIGLMARDVSARTFFPVFLYAQAFMGSLEAYLYSVLFSVFGATPGTMELLPFFITSLVIVFSALLAYRIYSFRVAAFTVIFLSFAPIYFARWNFEARPHYSLTVLFGTLLILFTYNLIYGRTRHRRLHYILIGFLSGLGWWTNFLIAVYLLTVGAFLFLNDKKIFIRRNFWLMLLFFFIGSAPFWYFNATHSFVSLHLKGIREFSQIPSQIGRIFRIALPDTVSLEQPPDGHPALVIYILIGLFYVASIFSEIFKRRKGLRSMFSFSLKKTTGAEMFLFHMVVFFGILCLSHYSRRIRAHDAPYMLGFYPFIMIILASLLSNIWKRRKIASLALTWIIISANVYNTARKPDLLTRGGFIILNPTGRRQSRSIMDGYQAFVRFAEENSIWFVYGDDTETTFYSGEKIIFASPYENYDPRRATLVDAAERIGWAPGAKRDLFENNLKAIGAEYEEDKSYPIFYNFKKLYQSFVEIDPSGFEAEAAPGNVNAHLALDRNILTRWTSNCPRAPGMFYQLDMGGVYPICKVTVLPGYWRDCPGGYRLEVSNDGKIWKEVLSVEDYWGPLFWSGPHPFLKVRRGRHEIIFPETKCRFIRITQTGASRLYYWSINEIYVYGRGKSEVKVRDIHELVNFLQEGKIEFACADHWLSANIRKLTGNKVKIYPSNLFTGRNREMSPPAGTIDAIILTPERAIIVEEEEAFSTAKVLKRSHISFEKVDVGGYSIFLKLKREEPDCREIREGNWQASSNHNPDLGQYAFDRNPETRWHTGKPQKPGMYFGIDLGEVQTVSMIKLILGEFKKDYPRGFILEASMDGENWQRQRISITGDKLYWSGFDLLQLYDREVTVNFAPQVCQYLRMTLTAETDAWWWSIAEILIYSPGGSISENLLKPSVRRPPQP